MSSFDLQALEDELLGGLEPQLPPRPVEHVEHVERRTTVRRTTVRRLSSARSRYDSSVRQAVAQTTNSIMVRAHCGWLEKVGKLVRNWKRRWFTFDPCTLTISYFQDETCTTKKNEFELDIDSEQPLVTYLDKDQNIFAINCKGRQLICKAPTSSAVVTWMACLDNEYFYSSLRNEVDVRLNVLTKGCLMEKHGRSGSPHERFVWLTKDEQKIAWIKNTKDMSNKRITKDSFMYVENIIAIERGRTTKVFKRKAGGQLKNAPDSQAFSIVCSDRTFDVIAPDVATAEAWISGISYLTLFTHASTQRATRTGRWLQPKKQTKSKSTRTINRTKTAGASAGRTNTKTETTNAGRTMHATLETKKKLEERGRKIDELQDKSAKLENTGSDFATLCQAVNEQQGRRGFFF